jgi:hypothetical protein
MKPIIKKEGFCLAEIGDAENIPLNLREKSHCYPN